MAGVQLGFPKDNALPTALSYQRLDDFWAVFSEGELSVYVSNFVVCLLKISTQEIINFIDG